jgi:hypothetical protein
MASVNKQNLAQNYIYTENFLYQKKNIMMILIGIPIFLNFTNQFLTMVPFRTEMEDI